MPDWLGGFSVSTDNPALPVLAFRLALAWGCGWIVAVLARRKLPKGAQDTLTLTLVLMCILIAMATQIIGDNVARAFSLVGALSIVRFRTAVPATRDVAFVLAAVVVGMAIGAGQYWVTALGLLFVGLATQFSWSTAELSEATSAPSQAELNWRLTILASLSANAPWEADLARLTKSYRLVSAETTRRGASMEYAYRLCMASKQPAVELIAAIQPLPQVESVALKEC